MLKRIITIVVLGFIAYGAMLTSPFKTLDDRFSIIENPAIKSAAHIPTIFKQGFFRDQSYYRPLVNLSFMAEFHAFKLNAFFYNLDNLIVHILNAVLVLLLTTRLTQNPMLGFWSAVLFVIHPVQWEAVCNISGRAILLSTFFSLSSYILFLKAYHGQRWLLLLPACGTFFFGLLCKESSGILPAVLVLYLWLDQTRPWRVKAWVILPFVVVIVAYACWRLHLGITGVLRADDFQVYLLGFVTFLRSAITHLRLFILPIDLHFDRCWPLFKSFTSIGSLGAIVFWIALISGVYTQRKKIPRGVIALMIWFAIELLPVSQLVTSIGVAVGWISTAEHFLYTPSIPVFIAAALAFQWVLRVVTQRASINPRFVQGCVGGFLIFLLLTAVEQSIYASQEFTMLKRSLQFEPKNPRVQASMGLQYVFREDFVNAEKHFQAAVNAEPLNQRYRMTLGTSLCQQGRWVECLGQYVALDNPTGLNAELLKKQQEITAGHIEEDRLAGKALDDKGWFVLGVHYAKQGQMDKAIEAFSAAVTINPQMADAWLNLGSLYEAREQWLQAQEAYQQLMACQGLSDFQRQFGTMHLTSTQGH